MPEVLTVNEEQLVFYHQIGFAITQWAHVEFALFDIATACLAGEDALGLHIAFFSIENFRNKLRLVDNLLAAKFSGTAHFTRWPNELHPRIESNTKARNMLAHYWVLNYPHEKPGHRCCLLPRLPNLRKPPPKKQQKRPPGTIGVRDISLMQQRFSVLANILHNFAQELRGKQGSFPEPTDDQLRARTLPQLRDMLRALTAR